MRYTTVEINGTDMFAKYGAVLSQQHSVQPPVPKMSYQDIPGADGSADLSTAVAGRLTYNRRVITMAFQCEHGSSRWTRIFSEILAEFHGKECKITFGDDLSYYYVGRLEVSGYERVRTHGTFTISTNAEPYKHEKLSSLEPWLWSTFNFKTGIIRNYGNLAVNGTRTLRIPGTERWVIPIFIVTGNIQVTFAGRTYTLKPGKNKIYDIVIELGTNILTFVGNGTVSVDYRGGKL